MRLVLRKARASEILARLSTRDTRMGEDARAAVEWLTAGDDDDSAVFTRRRLQLFLWYELPRKWLVEPHEHLAVAEALATFLDQVGPAAAPLSALCRDSETSRLLRNEGEGFVAAIEASGLEPPDTPLLEWSDLMTIEESLERDAVAEMLEQSVDDGELVPGARRWKERQAELVEAYLITPDAADTTPLSRVLTARRQAWLELFEEGAERTLMDTTTPRVDDAPTRAEVEVAIEPLLWLLGCLADGLKLTQTGALPRALVREAVERYADWWDRELFGPPQREAEVYPLEVLHTIVDELKLARRQRGILKLSPRGRSLHADPSALLWAIASTVAAQGGSTDLDRALADLLRKQDGFDFRLVHLLGPFYGIIGGRFRMQSEVTQGGLTLAAAILRARAYGPRHTFA